MVLCHQVVTQEKTALTVALEVLQDELNEHLHEENGHTYQRRMSGSCFQTDFADDVTSPPSIRLVTYVIKL